jgi:hypothetical protein
MTDETSRPSEPAGGDGLLFIIAAAVIVVVIGEAAFVAFPRQWMLPLAILGALIITVGVIYAAMRTIDNDTPVIAPPAEAEPIARPVIGH